jgi:hypothetical protein
MGLRPLVMTSAAAAAAILPLTAIRHASAHAVVQAGSVTVAIGWLHEPAYVGADNAVQVLVKDAQGNALDSITDKDLQVEVGLDTAKMAAQPLVPTFDPDTGLGLHGEYEFHLTPTAPGKYTFHVFGKIAGATPIDQTLTAGDTTFNAVTDQSAVEFPNKVPAASDLSQKVDAVGARVDAASGAAQKAQQAVATAQSQADDAKSAANRALVVGLVALVLGLFAGGAGLLAALRARRR